MLMTFLLFYIKILPLLMDSIRPVFKKIWKVRKVGKVGKVCKVGNVGMVGKVGREGTR